VADVAGRYREVMAGDGGWESRFGELFVSAREARNRARDTVRRTEAALQENKTAWQSYQRAGARAEKLCESWLSGRRDAMRYSAHARLQARLASMPVIEQAKGVIMVQFGWTEEQAFEALRKASQRSNVRVRDLAAMIVARTARSAQPRSTVDRTQVAVLSLPEIQPTADPAATMRALPARHARGASAG
jgi:hypothetical protein